MYISKTMFKNATRCKRFIALEMIHRNNKQSFQDNSFDDLDDKLSDLLDAMFNENGDSKIDITNDQLETMLPYFTEIEVLAGELIKKKFGDKVQVSTDTREQKYFEYNGKNDLYCYVDAYQETDEGNFNIFEVKSTTSNKFISMGPEYRDAPSGSKQFDKYNSIFRFDVDGILRLREEIDPENYFDDHCTKKKYANQRIKLFDRYHNAGKYVYDLAVQRFIIENSLITLGKEDMIDKINYYLVVLNPAYTFDGEYINGKQNFKTDQKGNDIVTFIDLTTITKEYMTKIKFDFERLNTYIEENDSDPVRVDKHCERNKTTQCKYFDICFDKVPKYNSIFTYIHNHHGFKDSNNIKHERYDMIENGMVSIKDIPLDWINRKVNQIQRDVIYNNKPYVNYRKIEDGINQLRYPIYHLDFETFPCPLPRFSGETPYMQSVFQYSLHIEKEPGVCNKETDHYEFLSGDHQDRREELVKSMVSHIDLDSNGTILVYNQAFEKTRLKELAVIFPQYKDELYKMIDMLFDLMYIVKTNKDIYLDLGYSEEEAKLINIYYNELNGSYSIKKVLPLFSNLSYDDLDVANGMQAVITYATFETLRITNPELYKMKYSALVEYCKQDTWAMFEVLEGLKRLIRD